MKESYGIEITTDKRHIEFERVCTFLQSTYWGAGRSPYSIRTSFENSLCFIARLHDPSHGPHHNRQIGFARVVTDKAFFAYIFDLFVFDDFRGHGIAKKLMHEILSHKELEQVPSFMLGTDNAHDLYRKFGFQNYIDSGRLMVRRV